MRIDYDLEEIEQIPEPKYWAFPDALFYPGVDFISELPELIVIKESLEEYTGLRVFYGIETESDENATSDEVILCALSDEDNNDEYLQYICTPFGTYTILYFHDDKDGQMYEEDPAILTDELKEILWLRPCEIEGEDHCYATYVGASPTMQFPPEKPDAYLYGSEARKFAEEYWKRHADDPDPEEEEPYVDEQTGMIVFTNQEAAENYIRNIVAEAEDGDEIPSAVAYVSVPIFHDYVIRIM